MTQLKEPIKVGLDLQVCEGDDSYRLEIDKDELSRTGNVNVLVVVKRLDQSERRATLVMVPQHE